LAQHGPFLRVSDLVNAPEGVRLDLVDPLHLLLVAPGRALAGLGGATLAWNLWHLLGLVVLAWGTARLARVLGAAPLGRAVAVAGALATPYIWGGLPLGRSELLGCLLVPLLLSVLAESLSWPRGLLAAILVAAIGLSGWQPLLLSALALVPAGLVLVAGSARRGRRLLGRLLIGHALVAAGGAILLLPMLWTQLATSPWWTERLHDAVALGPDAGGSSLLAALRLDGLRPPMATAVAPYPGWGLLLLALLGLTRRRSRPWALLALSLVLLTLGPRLSLPGGWRADVGPAWLLVKTLPPYAGLVDWARLSLVAGPLCAVAGGLSWTGRRSLFAAFAVALLLADGLSWRLDAPAAFEVAPPDDVAAAFAALPAGPVLELPGVAPDERDHLADNDLSMLWALTHRHPVTAVPSPGASAMLGRSLLFQLHRGRPPRRGDPCAATEGARLYDQGFRGVVLYADRLDPRRSAPLRRQLDDILGPAAGDAGSVSWWTLRAGDTGPQQCSVGRGGG